MNEHSKLKQFSYLMPYPNSSLLFANMIENNFYFAIAKNVVTVTDKIDLN